MLSRSPTDATVRWLSVRPTDVGYAVRLHLVHHEGSAGFLDVYEFPPVEDEHPGEGRLVGQYTDLATAMNAASAIGAVPDRWVNEGVVQDEYADLLGSAR